MLFFIQTHEYSSFLWNDDMSFLCFTSGGFCIGQSLYYEMVYALATYESFYMCQTDTEPIMPPCKFAYGLKYSGPAISASMQGQFIVTFEFYLVMQR
jgi:hypothetical protein